MRKRTRVLTLIVAFAMVFSVAAFSVTAMADGVREVQAIDCCIDVAEAMPEAASDVMHFVEVTSFGLTCSWRLYASVCLCWILW